MHGHFVLSVLLSLACVASTYAAGPLDDPAPVPPNMNLDGPALINDEALTNSGTVISVQPAVAGPRHVAYRGLRDTTPIRRLQLLRGVLRGIRLTLGDLLRRQESVLGGSSRVWAVPMLSTLWLWMSCSVSHTVVQRLPLAGHASAGSTGRMLRCSVVRLRLRQRQPCPNRSRRLRKRPLNRPHRAGRANTGTTGRIGATGTNSATCSTRRDSRQRARRRVAAGCSSGGRPLPR